MPLSVGERLGPYEILAPLGAGGMGEVYRARDTKLKRDVALKVLPDAFARDADRMARFQREAEVLASLNHPNIAAIYGVEDRALVMELVEGAEPRGPLDFEDAWHVASQIAAALEYAHDRGIVHRDLKPANIKITPEGVVKLLDFGLAKAFTAPKDASPIPDGEKSPTMTLGATEVGVLLGTAAYMAPEQAKGKNVDKRADIWAFGVVLYELLTGQRLFQGDDASETLAQVLTKQPDLDRVPPKARRLLRECLQKDPKQRLRDIGDAKRLIEETAPAQGSTSARTRLAMGLAAAALFIVASAFLAFVIFRRQPPEAPLVRTTILPPDRTSFDFQVNHGPVAVSPDGRRLVFVASSPDGKTQLWIRPLDSLLAQSLAGTGGASFPFWSPDSRFVGFFAGGKLKKIGISGGTPITLADAPNPRGGTWSSTGVIVFSPTTPGPLHRVSDAGGVAIPATTVKAENGGNHRAPWFLPDGRHFLYEQVFAGRHTLRVASLDSAEDQVVGEANSNPIYSQGHLLFLRQTTLMAQPFDLKRLALTAEAVPVAEQIQQINAPGNIGCFSVSATGLLVYQTGEGAGGLTLKWFDRRGKPAGALGEAAYFGNIELSPDRRSLAARIVDQSGSADIWIYDVLRGLRTRFTFDPAAEFEAIWSPDGRSIIFSSNRKGYFDLYRKSSDGSGAEELLYADNHLKRPLSWSPDRKVLLYSANDPQTGSDLWTLPLTGDPKPVPFLRTAFNEDNGQFSPDGRWVAYQSNESGRDEIYAAPFPGPGGKRQISSGGGRFPRWRRDGKEIFYVGAEQRLTAAEVIVKGDRLEVAAMRPLFGSVYVAGGFYTYDISADGQSILMAIPTAESASEPLTLVQNWTAGLEK
jgi:serine/threonine protein kinase/Tol biopolymer transport system component